MQFSLRNQHFNGSNILPPKGLIKNDPMRTNSTENKFNLWNFEMKWHSDEEKKKPKGESRKHVTGNFLRQE